MLKCCRSITYCSFMFTSVINKWNLIMLPKSLMSTLTIIFSMMVFVPRMLYFPGLASVCFVTHSVFPDPGSPTMTMTCEDLQQISGMSCNDDIEQKCNEWLRNQPHNLLWCRALLVLWCDRKRGSAAGAWSHQVGGSTVFHTDRSWTQLHSCGRGREGRAASPQTHLYWLWKLFPDPAHSWRRKFPLLPH